MSPEDSEDVIGTRRGECHRPIDRLLPRTTAFATGYANYAKLTGRPPKDRPEVMRPDFTWA